MLWLNGVSSRTAGVTVEHRAPRPIPREKTIEYTVPGRSGKIIRRLGAWEDVTLRYELALLPRPGEPVSRAADRAVAWLQQAGTLRLEDDTDPGVFYLATYLGGEELEDLVHISRRATVNFNAAPQRWLKSGELPLRFTQAGTLVNPTGYTAKPLIAVQGSGSGSFTLGETTVTLSNCNGLTLDCETGEASGVANANKAVSGDLPELGAGVSALRFSGGITAIEITPRWYRL